MKKLLKIAVIGLYAVSMLIDLTMKTPYRLTEPLKYGVIVGCAALTVLNDRRDPALIGVFGWILASDFLLLFTPEQKLGVAIFLGAHATNILRNLCRERRQMNRWMTAIMIGPMLAFQLLDTDTIALIYALMILADWLVCLAGWRRQPRQRERRNGMIGMSLFLLCDLCVLFYNAVGSYRISQLFYHGIWLFYLPALFFLAQSGLEYSAGSQSRFGR